MRTKDIEPFYYSPVSTTDLTPMLQTTYSEKFPDWLQQQKLSLAFTTYQTNRLFCMGTTLEGRMALHERLFDKPMGLFVKDEPEFAEASQKLYMSTRYQIWQLDNLLTSGEERNACDRLYTPKLAHTTGDLNVHDVVLDQSGELLFVNTDFSCLARLSADYSFVPLWQPPFISKLVAEDRCHLNGLAMREGQPAYMTACSQTNHAAGWRNHRIDGGVVLDIQTNEIIATGLSMPHSPRWYHGKLWLLNSGSGELGHLELDSGTFIPLTFCPGFVRGLAFHDNYAIVGLSKLRSKPFSGLALEETLASNEQQPHCGLMVIDLETGNVLHWLNIEGIVEELFDVVVLADVRQPQSIGFQSDEIERLVTFPDGDGIMTTKPTVKPPSLSRNTPIAGVPREVWEHNIGENGANSTQTSPQSISPTAEALASLKFQQVYQLTADNLANYDALTYPSFQKRRQTHPQQGELFGISASVKGEMVAFGITERSSVHAAELISLFVTPHYRHNGIGTKLVAHLETELRKEGCLQIAIAYSPTSLTEAALEPILQKLGWQPPTQNQGQRYSQKLLGQKISTSPPVNHPAHHHFEQGKILTTKGNFEDAQQCFIEAIRLYPIFLKAHNQLGKIYQQLGKLEEAIAIYQTILKIHPNLAQAHCNLGSIWQLQGKIEKAIAAYETATTLNPNLAIASLNLAQLRVTQGHYPSAIKLYKKAFQADPKLIEAQYGLGKVFVTQKRIQQAKACMRQVLTHQPDHAAALFDLGCLSEMEGDLETARHCYQNLFDHHDDLKYLSAYQLCYVKRQLCEWTDNDDQMADLLKQIAHQVSQSDSHPFLPLSLSIFDASPKLHQAVNELYAARIQRRVETYPNPPVFQHPTATEGKLKIGYVSPDYCNHPVGWLVQEFFPHHNRQKFTIIAYSLHNAQDPIQDRIKAGCDQFIDCSEMSPQAIAQRIHADGIHILIDLAGYTARSCPEIFALRPAPIQCSYLGYPDTTGANHIDYLMTDQWVVPPALAEHCSEEVIYLPHQFVVSPQFGDFAPSLNPEASKTTPISPESSQELKKIEVKDEQLASLGDRQAFELPPDGFVFCCFNVHRKISPTLFAIWMRILRQVPGAVLWLSDGPDSVKTNLSQSAQSHEIESDRIIFASRLSFEDYLARYRFADLFLDTFTYSAGSTAICALTEGVPILTYPGKTNASRMGASIAASAGLEELICDSIEAYEQKAVYLGNHPHKIADFRQELQQNRSTIPLFQPQKWILHLENTYWNFWDQYQAEEDS